MANTIAALGAAAGLTPAGVTTRPISAPASGGSSAGSFAESLGKLIDGAEAAEDHANESVLNMMNKTGEVHDAMIALQRAEMSLQLTVQVRNKLVNAYHEIMRMPV